MFEEIIENVKKAKPLVHCITNYVTANDCANVLLACGGSPIMADDRREVEEITRICSALVINIGTLNERTVESMILAGKTANQLGHPVILDPVGAGASTFRTETTKKLLQEIQFSVIRGNISEIKTVALGSGTTKGVDADAADQITEQNLSEAILYARELSKKTNAVIAITGEIDLVVDEKEAYVIHNGHQAMAKVSGTGCMLSAILGAYCSANMNSMTKATTAAVSIMGLSGELAYEKMLEQQTGTSSYLTYIIDEISKMTTDKLERGANVESR